MDKVTAWVVRPFHVYAAPEREGEKERRVDYEAGQQIDCTPEQLEVGQAAGVLSDAPPPRFAEGESAPTAGANAVRPAENEE